MAGSGLAVSLRPMRLDDVEAVAALEREVFSEPWSLNVFRDELSHDDRRYVIVEDEDGAAFGYGGMMILGEDAHVVTLAVADTQRRQGVGGRILLDLIETARVSGVRHLTLEVRRSNRSARGLYERFGFARVGLRKDYYRGEDAVVMWAIDIDAPEYGEHLDELRRSLE